VVGALDVALGGGGLLPAELIRDAAKRTLEIRRELPSVPAARAPGHAIALDEHHLARGGTQGEEGRGDACNARAHDHDGRARVADKRRGWPILCELRDPGGAIRRVRVGPRPSRLRANRRHVRRFKYRTTTGPSTMGRDCCTTACKLVEDGLTGPRKRQLAFFA